jgi:ferrochelatase
VLLQGLLGERGHRVQVRWAMRYGQPGIAAELDALRAAGAQRILVFNAYPQYCGATVGSNLDVVAGWMQRQRALPELRFVNHYHDDEDHLRALARSVKAHWQREGQADLLLMSFHGMPERTLQLGDPYHCECHKTARLLAERLGLQARAMARQLPEPLRPRQMAGAEHRVGAAGAGRAAPAAPRRAVPRICRRLPGDPGGNRHRGRRDLPPGRRRALRYIPCLNDSAEGMQSLAAIAERHLSGWPATPTADELSAQAARARALGAPA